MIPYLVSVERVIDAPAQLLFDFVADPANHPRIDGSGTVQKARPDNPAGLSPGARFSMDMRIVAPYVIKNEVVEFEEGRQIGWRHFNGHIWRWIFEPGADGTRVTEQWDARPARFKLALRVLGFDRSARDGMAKSLDRLATLAATE